MARGKIKEGRRSTELSDVIIAEWFRIRPETEGQGTLPVDVNALTAAFNAILDSPCKVVLDAEGGLSTSLCRFRPRIHGKNCKNISKRMEIFGRGWGPPSSSAAAASAFNSNCLTRRHGNVFLTQRATHRLLGIRGRQVRVGRQLGDLAEPHWQRSNCPDESCRSDLSRDAARLCERIAINGRKRPPSHQSSPVDHG